MEHSVVVANVTAHQLRDAIGIGRKESDSNNLGHGLILERVDRLGSDCGHRVAGHAMSYCDGKCGLQSSGVANLQLFEHSVIV